MLIVTKTPGEIREIVEAWKVQNLTIGLVPTMGFLHEGHASLIKKAREENDRVIVSDFVNPIQFGPSEDFEAYPRDFEADRALCEELGADMIFNPEAPDMYAENFSTYVNVDEVTEGLCGAKRPGHFKGVCTVVSKLFNLSGCDRAYFGQKDAQQLAVIRRMVRDLNFPIDIVGCPIIREEDGLAKSSRNTYLSPNERKAATVLNRSLQKGMELVLEDGIDDANTIKDAIRMEIDQEGLAMIDYIEVVEWDSLANVSRINGPVLVAIAVYIGKTRLIDNFIIGDAS